MQSGEGGPQDTEAEGLRLVRGRAARYFFIGLGTLSLGTGILGVFLPVVPTTPFLLLAAACYARGSERLYRRLLTSRVLGTYIGNWRRHGGIPLRMKVAIILTIAAAVGLSAYVGVHSTPLRLLLVALGAVGMVVVARIPSKAVS